jgi:hypothetical protein
VHEPTSPPAQPARLALQGNVIRFGDATLRFRDRFESWTRVLGPPSRTLGPRHLWFGDTVEVVTSQTVDGRAYVEALLVRLGTEGPPGGFVLQGIPLARGQPRLASIMKALARSPTPLWGMGQGPLFEAATMKATEPDGFVTTVRATLDCLPHLSPGSTGSCEQAIDGLEIRADWQ